MVIPFAGQVGGWVNGLGGCGCENCVCNLGEYKFTDSAVHKSYELLSKLLNIPTTSRFPSDRFSQFREQRNRRGEIQFYIYWFQSESIGQPLLSSQHVDIRAFKRA